MATKASIKDRPKTTETRNGYLDEFAVAAYLGVSDKTLRGWRVLGKGPPYRKFHNAVRYSFDDLQAWATSTPQGGNGVTASTLRAGAQ